MATEIATRRAERVLHSRTGHTERVLSVSGEGTKYTTAPGQVDHNLREKNIYYDDLIAGNILQPLKIRPVKKNGFIDYMKSVGKLGGQNKVPRLSNDRKLVAELERFTE